MPSIPIRTRALLATFRGSFCLALCAVLAAAVLPVAADAATYQVDPEQSELAVQLYKAGFASAFAHDHVVTATRFSGEVVYDPDDLGSASVSLEAEAAGLVVDEPEARSRYGIEGDLSDEDRAKIQSTMEGADQLAVEKYPTVSLESTSVEPGENGQLQVTARFTLHGETRSVTFPAQVEVEDGGLHATGEFRFKQSDYGIKPFSAKLGAVRNQDEILLHFDVRATEGGEESEDGESEDGEESVQASDASGETPEDPAPRAAESEESRLSSSVSSSSSASSREDLPATAGEHTVLLLLGVLLAVVALAVRQARRTVA